MRAHAARTLGAGMLLAVASTLALGCADTGASQNGFGESFRVRNAQFLREPLPGTKRMDGGMSMPAADGGVLPPPRITQALSGSLLIAPGQVGKKFNGFCTNNTYAVGVALDDTSAGHWVLPVGAPDPAMGALSWDITTDFSDAIGPGRHVLYLAAIDEHGAAGEQTMLGFCVRGRIPDNLHACDDKNAPPRAVIALTWDTEVDLDLQVIAPNGVVTDSKHPHTGQRDSTLPPPDDGVLDRDSNASCNIDGLRAESLVWNKSIPHGKYGMYVNLFSACKQAGVNFKVSVYTAAKTKAGSEELRLWYEQAGQLPAVAENGGAARGLFVGEFQFK